MVLVQQRLHSVRTQLFFLFIVYFSLLLLRMNLKSIGFCGFAFNAPQLDGKSGGEKKKISII